MPVGATLGAGVLGAGATIFGANKAASTQAASTAAANALIQRQQDQTQANLSPFIQGGSGAFNTLLQKTPDLTKPFDPANLDQTPGYQFTLQQGLKAGQNSAAAKGLGSSGFALKGAETFAEGLASTTFQQQLDNYLKQNTSTYNMLLGETQVGSNAASGVASTGATAANAMGNNLIGAGNAQGAATMAGANAITGALTNASNAYSQNQLITRLLAGNNGGALNLGTSGGTAGVLNPLV